MTAVVVALLSACGTSPDGQVSTAPGPSGTVAPSGPARLVHVPADAPTITAGLALATPGSVVLVSAGTYRESVTVTTPDVTLRGESRDGVVIDGEGLRSNGVQVVADGVRVENLTVVNHTFNGVLVTGMHDGATAEAHNMDGYTRLDPERYPPLQRFEVSHVTARNNGLYGIYAFNTNNGVIADSYASGAADSGFYVGQCARCRILVTGNVAENNAIGYENANASDSVLITGNRFSGNRVGLTLLSWYQEAYLPQHGDTVVGNVISDNVSATSPSQADGGFGIGVGLSGAQGNLLVRNRITGNPVAGVQLTNTEDIASSDNSFVDNHLADNGLDAVDVSAARTPSSGMCFSDPKALTILPESLATRCPHGSPESAGVAGDRLPQVTAPEGMSFLQVPAGPAQPDLPGDLTALPGPLPAVPGFPEVDDVPLPAADLLAERAATAG